MDLNDIRVYLENAERALSQVRRSLDQLELDPKRYAPQEENLRQAALIVVKELTRGILTDTIRLALVKNTEPAFPGSIWVKP